MAWLALILIVLAGSLAVMWITTRQSRLARIIGEGSVMSLFALMFVLGQFRTFQDFEQTNFGVWVVGLAVIATQATVLAILTVWIASRRSRLARSLGGIFISVLALMLTYGIIFGPMWKTNFVIIALMMMGWVGGRNSRLPITE
jgi:hypothetical protein